MRCNPNPVAVVLLACILASAQKPAAQAAPDEARACEPVNAIPFKQPPPFEMKSYRFSAGDVDLGGCLYKPKDADRFPVIVLVSGSDDVPTASDIYSVIHAKAFAARGVGVFAFNKRGLGDSGGVVTDTGFKERGADVAAAVRFVRSLPATTHVGLWGASQAGWVVPQALAPNDGIEFVILVSPAGISPSDQVAFFIGNVALHLGLSAAEAARAERLHRTVVRYYATGEGYAEAQAVVDVDRKMPWFEKFRANDRWDEKISAEGRLLTPAELAEAWKTRPNDFSFYRAADTFADYQRFYLALTRPTLIVQGSDDSIVPVKEANQVFATAFRINKNRNVEFKLFNGAGHGIQDGPRVRQAYLDFISEWASRQFDKKIP